MKEAESDTNELIQRIRSGDQVAYSAVIQRHQQALYAYCYHLLMQREEAEDAVQDVFIKAYEKLSQYTYEKSFSAWLYKIAYNHCMNLLQKRRRSALLNRLLSPLKEDWIDDGYSHTRKKEVREMGERVLLRLRPDDRVLILLRIMEGRSYEEISEKLPYTAATLRKKMERVKKKLKKAWIELEGCEDEYDTEFETTGHSIPRGAAASD